MAYLIVNARISRRQFLRAAGLTAGAMLAPLLSAAKPAAIPHAGQRYRFYRGTTDGKLLGSPDAQTWTLLTDFGPHLMVKEIKVTQDGWLQSVLMLAGSQSVILKSRDGKTWYTQDYVAPGQA